jgi:hypothetical protein
MVSNLRTCCIADSVIKSFSPERVLLQLNSTKTGRHDIAEILLKVALNTINIKKIYYFMHISKVFKGI